jgi:hypothetical protein
MVPPDTDTSTTSTTPRSSRRTRTPHASPSIHTIGLPPALPAPPLPALPSTYEYEMAPSLGQKRAHTPLSPTPRSPNAPRSGEVSDDDFDHDMLAPRARVRGSVTPTPTSPTPRRKIVNAMDAPVPRAAKRPALADRLSAAATPSRRMSAIPVPIVTRSAASPIPSPVVASASDKNDKVIVCMRYVLLAEVL